MEPVVSILLPTTHGWPAVAEALQSVLAQRDAPHFEVLVLDGDGHALEGAPAQANVRWIRLAGLDSFALRAAGIASARGSIVAITEDHCVAPPDWVASIAAAHRDDRSAAIVGAVRNHPDTAKAAADRANFILTFAGQTRLRRLPVPTNVSFKRSALPETALAPGEFEYRWLAELMAKHAITACDAILLHHKQSWGSAVWRIHVASGRSYGAAVHEAPLRTRLSWWLRFPAVPIRLLRLTWPEVETARDCVYVTALIAANLCGQIIGALFGAGASRELL